MGLFDRARSQETFSWFWSWDPPPCFSERFLTSYFDSTKMSLKWRCRWVNMLQIQTVFCVCVNQTIRPDLQKKCCKCLFCVLQVIMLSSVTELHSYIDRSQLTQELGGTQEYCHEKWISHRTVSSTFILMLACLVL